MSLSQARALSQKKTAPVLVVFTILAGLTALPGCSIIAGLDEEHQLRLSRWPDSATSFCANDSAIIACPAAGQPFHGQDCCYSINTPEYMDDGEIVHDTVTGLDWRRHPDPTLMWKDAADGCAGFGDGYRLPSRLELLSLTDYGRPPAKIGPALFHDLAPEYHWTSSIDAEMAEAYAVHLGCGPFPCEKPTLSPSPVSFPTTTRLHNDKELHALCVKGEPLFEAPPPPPGAASSDMVTLYTDKRTGLFWSAAPRMGTFQGALEACENLVDDGAQDWRLPNIKELQTLVNEMAPEPSKFLPFGDENLVLWSSTPYVGAPGLAHALYANGGSAFVDLMSVHYYGVACVRGPYPPP